MQSPGDETWQEIVGMSKQLFPVTLGSVTDDEPPRKHPYMRAKINMTAAGCTVPNLASNLQNFTLIDKPTLGKLRHESDELQRIKKALSSRKLTWGLEAYYLIAAGLAQVPQASHYALEQFIPCLKAALLRDRA